MVNVISQETFDSVVMENVIEFDMSLEDAIIEAQKEFDAQGVHLGMVVKDGELSSDGKSIVHGITVAVTALKAAVSSDSNPTLQDAEAHLTTLTTHCKRSLAHRVLANNNEAYDTLLKLLKNAQNDPEFLSAVLGALVSLTESNPDILTAEGSLLMIQMLDEWKMRNDNPTVPEFLCLWCKWCCVKHERNRQNLADSGALGALVGVLQGQKTQPTIVRASAKALKSFALDDDIRQEFGKAHEHARLMAEEHHLISACLELIKDFLGDSETTSDLLGTVRMLCVRAEYCQEAVDKGGLTVINDILVSFPDHAALNKQAISLLKAISGNDKVKDQAMKSGVAPLLVASMARHENVKGVCEEGCGAVSMLALRSPSHARQLQEAGAGRAVLQGMKIHPNSKQMQKLGCMAIRNLATRVPENHESLKADGVEGVIQTALQIHGEIVKDVARAALRDLNLQVELVEQWRGTGHEISR